MPGPQPRSLPRQNQTLFATWTFSGFSDRQLLERVVAEPGTDYNENCVLIVVESMAEGKVQATEELPR
jgi:hypothetical protein